MILVVEDDLEISDSVCAFLEQEGYQVKAFAAGRPALNWLNDHEPDLIILDHTLPDMTGSNILDKLAQRGAMTPFIIATGHGSEKLAVQLMKQGASDYLVKDHTFWTRLGPSVKHVMEHGRTAKSLRAAEESLASQTHLIQLLFDLFPCEALILRATGEVVSCNPIAYEKGFELEKRCAHIRGFPDRALCPWCRMPQVLETRCSQSTEVEANGQFLEILWVPLDHDLCLHLVFDRTERKRAELERLNLAKQLHQMQKMDAIGRLTSGVAHDFNNYIVGIMGYADLLETLLDPGGEPRQYVQEISKTAERAGELVTRLLSFARREDLNLVPVDVHKILLDTANLLKTNCKLIELELQLTAQSHEVLGEAGQLETALLNLGMNARDAMPGGGRLSFRTENLVLEAGLGLAEGPQSETQGGYLCILVTDSGGGISPEALEHIFEPFFTTKPLGKGTGLGLSNVYGTIRNHHGSIDVQSVVNQQTTFRIILPLAPGLPEEQGRATNTKA